MSARKRRQIRDLRHKGTRKVITFCQAQGGGRLFIGNPAGVRKRNSGRHHNQRMSGWEYGQDIAYLSSKAQAASIERFDFERAGNLEPVSGMRLETTRQRAAVALPQPPVLLCRAPGCGRQRQPAPAGLWDQDGLPRSHHVSTSWPREGPGTG